MLILSDLDSDFNQIEFQRRNPRQFKDIVKKSTVVPLSKLKLNYNNQCKGSKGLIQWDILLNLDIWILRTS